MSFWFHDLRTQQDMRRRNIMYPLLSGVFDLDMEVIDLTLERLFLLLNPTYVINNVCLDHHTYKERLLQL